MKNRTRRTAGLLAVLALAFPALADAGPGKGSGKERKSEERSERLRPWNVQGTVTAKGDTTVTLKIRRSSHGTRALRDQEVTFDMAAARVLVRDVNGDGQKNFADVTVGDRAQVKARLPRRRAALDVTQVIPARLGVFKAPKPPVEEPEDEAPESDS
jgi:hypothetical protein